MFHSIYLPANAGRSTTKRRPACGRTSSHVRSYLVPRSLTSKESVVFLLRLRCNRLLRRQHCSSLCLQSELQCFASDLRRMFAQRLLANLDFLDFEHPLIPPKTVSFPLGRIQKAPRRSLMKQGMPRGLSFSCHLPLPLYWRGERSRETIMCCYGLRALPPTRPSAVFCGYQNFTVPRLRSTSMPSWALRLNLPAFLALNLMVKSSWLPSSRRKLLPRLTKVG